VNLPSTDTRRSALARERPRRRGRRRRRSGHRAATPAWARLNAPLVTRSTRPSGRAVLGLIFASLLVVTQTFPALSGGLQNSSDTAQASDASWQTLTATGAAAPVVRDQFSVIPPPFQLKVESVEYSSLSQMTFTNIPTSDVQWPFASSRVSSDFGPRVSPCSGCSSNHRGVDFVPGVGTPISAVADGVVRVVRNDSGGFGTHVVIDHVLDGVPVSSTYAHMQVGSVPLSVGQAVSVGDTVGQVGNTGNSTGPHLHLEIKVKDAPVDSFAFLKANVR
jgi:murein DD-endopeptidase MepM/ murein hydrolase activator NlpD